MPKTVFSERVEKVAAELEASITQSDAEKRRKIKEGFDLRVEMWRTHISGDKADYLREQDKTNGILAEIRIIDDAINKLGETLDETCYELFFPYIDYFEQCGRVGSGCEPGDNPMIGEFQDLLGLSGMLKKAAAIRQQLPFWEFVQEVNQKEYSAKNDFIEFIQNLDLEHLLAIIWMYYLGHDRHVEDWWDTLAEQGVIGVILSRLKVLTETAH